MFQTEHEFTLKAGYVDSDGTVHKNVVMRRATAADQILPLSDPRVVMNPSYGVIIRLSRVITRLGPLRDGEINPKIIEGLYASDVADLQNFYNSVNRVEEAPRVTCPKCQHTFPAEAPSSIIHDGER